MARRQGAPVCGQFGQGKVAKSRGNTNLLSEIEAENFPPVFFRGCTWLQGKSGDLSFTRLAMRKLTLPLFLF